MSGDGIADIVYAGYPEVNIPPFANNSSRIHAVDGAGQPLWTSHAPNGDPYFIYVRHGAATIANLDDDPQAEIVFGTTILDHDGTVVFDQSNEWQRGGGVYGSNGDFLGGISAVADLTGDGVPEIVSGNEAWTIEWADGPMGRPSL